MSRQEEFGEGQGLHPVGTRLRLKSTPDDEKGFIVVGHTPEGSMLIKRAIKGGARPQISDKARPVGMRHVELFT